MNGLVRVELLGGLRVQAGEKAITRFTTRHAASLLAFLAFYRHQSHPREVLIEMLWQGVAPKDGRSRLSNALWSLRRQLEPPGTPAGAVLPANHFAVGLNPAVVTTDVAGFLAALRDAERAHDPAERIRHLREAVHLYGGELLPGFYEDWVLTEQRRLADLFDQAQESLATEESRPGARGKTEELAPAPDAAATSLPPSFTRFFGREAEAARLEGILAPGESEVRLVSVTGAGGAGKTRLCLEVARRLTGAYADAVWFVPLSDLSAPRGIGGVIGNALGLPRTRGVDPLDQAAEWLSRRPALLVLDNFEHLVDGGAEIVQSLLERAPPLTCLVTSRRLLGLSHEREMALAPLPIPEASDAPDRLVLCDSVRLFVDRAQTVRPDFQVTERNAAAIGELCQRLEGIPLAIELAAARARVLAPAQMLSHLQAHRFTFLVARPRDVAEHHRSLAGAMDWSYRLLAPELQQFFCRLSVFRGGWTVEAAEAVCEKPLALDYLEHLRENSFVLTEETGSGIRFRMLETLREYGADLLSTDEATAVRQHHRVFFAAVAEEARAELHGPRMAELLDRLEIEHDNIQAVLNGCLHDPDPASGEMARRLIRCLSGFWRMRGHLPEMRVWSLALLEHPEARARTSLRAWALNYAGNAAGVHGDKVQARLWLEESLVIRRELGDAGETGNSLNDFGIFLMHAGDMVTASALLEEALSIWRQRGARPAQCTTLINLGCIAILQDDHARARGRFAEALEICRETGEANLQSYILGNQAMMAAGEGDARSARALFGEALALQRNLADLPAVAQTLAAIGELERSVGNLERAARLLGASETLRRSIGIGPGPDEQKFIAAMEAAAKADDALVVARATGRTMDWQDAVTFALDA